MMHENLKFRPDPDVLVHRMGEDTILVHLRTNRLFEVNDTAAQLWSLLADGLSLGQIKRRLAEEYDVSRDRLDRDLAAMLDQFQQESLIVEHVTTGP
jgi:hypothetical protein